MRGTSRNAPDNRNPHLHHKFSCFGHKSGVFYTRNPFAAVSILAFQNPNLTMLYDTYGEEYLTFLRELNEILSVNELAGVDYL